MAKEKEQKRVIVTAPRIEQKGDVEIMTAKVAIKGSVKQDKESEAIPTNFELLFDIPVTSVILQATNSLVVQAQNKWREGKLPELTKFGAVIKASQIIAKTEATQVVQSLKAENANLLAQMKIMQEQLAMLMAAKTTEVEQE